MVLGRYGERLTDTDRWSHMVPAGSAAKRSGRRLMAFAVDCRPDEKRLPLYRTLEAGERLRARDVLYLVNEKGRWWLRRRSWKYRGV